MSASGLNLSSLKDKISNKLNASNSSKKNKKQNKNKKQTNTTTNETKSSTQESEDDDILRREALALGATEEDLELLKDVDEGEESEQEFNDDGTKLDKSFGDDLSKFMKGIGLGNGEAMVVDDDEVEEEVPELVESIQEEDEEEDDEGEDDDDEEEQSEESEIDTKAKKDELSAQEESDSSDLEESSDESSPEEEVVVKETKVDNKKQKAQDPDKITDFSMVSSSKLAIPSRTDWYNVPFDKPKEAPEKLDRFARERLLERAKTALDKDNKTYLEEFASNNSQKKFLSQILSDGTLNDKISALTLLIQEAPMHNLKALDTLLSYCEKKSRTAALQAINALKDLLLNGVLPDRKLVAFDKQPLRKDASDVELAIYYFEDHLKKAYFKLITILEVLSHDPIVHVRMNVVGHIFDLLKAKPEQEANLLKLGVNKLGDGDNKVAAKVSYQILQLEQAHPAMKRIVTDAVIDIVFKANSDDHATYYAVTTLNQTILTRKEEELANSLIKTYFALFEKVLVENDANNKENASNAKSLGESTKGRKNNRKNFKKGKKGGKSVKVEAKTEQEIIEEKSTRLFSALLTGLNRAFPFSNLPNDVFQSHLDTLFKITHSSNFNTSVQALVLVNHIITQQGLNSDRYYRTLYESLLDPRLATSSKQGIYLNLLFKSLKNDSDNQPRVLAFVKRILQICSHWLNVGAITGMLYLLTELSKTFPEIADLMIEVASRPDTEQVGKPSEDGKEIESKEDEEYDPKKRDPRYANADKSSLWELNQFLNHYHPTVAIYASSLLEGTEQVKPDLGLYTLSHFLDRFVYKNSKQKPQTKGSSIMQPLGGEHTGSLLVRATNVLDTEVPANTENWLNRKVEEIKPDEKFFHQYFTTKVNKIKAKKEEGQEELDEEEAEEMQDDEIWKALVKSKPEVEEPSEDELDEFDEEDFSDLDMDDGEDVEGEAEASEPEDEEVPSTAEVVDQEASEDEVEEDDFDEEEGEMFGINQEDELSDSEVELKVLEDEFSESNDEEEVAETPKKGKKKRSRDEKEDGKKKSKKAKLKDLPVFASVDDYSQYLASDDEDYS